MAQNDRYYIPALGNIYGSLHDWAHVIIRVGLGLLLLPHGMQKMFGAFAGPGMTNFTAMLAKVGYPMPGAFAWLIALTEIVGGVLLILGLFTRPVALVVAIFMLEAARFHLGLGGFFWTNRGNEYPILLFLCSIYLLIRGAGPYSVDQKMGREF